MLANDLYHFTGLQAKAVAHQLSGLRGCHSDDPHSADRPARQLQRHRSALSGVMSLASGSFRLTAYSAVFNAVIKLSGCLAPSPLAMLVNASLRDVREMLKS